MKTPKSVIERISPLTLSPLLKWRANSSHGFGLHCFIPRLIRRRSSWISSTITSTSCSDLNQPADFIAFAEMAREFLPRIRFALFHSQADPATLFVDFEHHHFHFLIELDSFAGRDIFICPIHFGNMHQPFDA